jgi:hypothetical protein
MLPDATKRDVLQWVRQNGDKTTLTPLEAVRLGIFKGIGADPTKAMLTQSFDDFSREDLLANQRGGEAVRNAYANVNNAIGNHLEMKSLSMGGNTGDRSVAGLNVIDALQAGRDESKKAVTAAYEAVRNDPAIGNKVGMGAVRKFLVEEHPSLIASPKTIALANGVKAWLNREGAIGPGAKPLTVEKVEAFKQWLNKQWDPTDEKVKITLRGLKDAADESVLKAGNGDLFDQARTAYKLTKDTYDNKALVRSLLDQKNPVDRKIAVEDAWDRVVLRSDVAQFADLKSTLQKGSRVTQGPNESETVARGNQAWKDTQAATMEWLIEKARSAEKGPNDTAIYMHSKLKSAMDQIGKEKLQILFGGDGVSALNQVLEAMRLAKPIKGTTNPSGSGNRIIQFFQDYLPKMAGGAAGAAAGGPIGAAAGAATADAVVGGVRAARAAQSAETITRQPVKAIDKDRYPTLDLTGFVPPGAPSASVGMTVRDLVNRRAENRAK